MSNEVPVETLTASDEPEVKLDSELVDQQAAEETPAETPEESTTEPEKEEVKQPPKWATKRINELTRDKYRERAEKEVLRRELDELRARVQADPQWQDPSGQLANAQQPQQQPVNPADIRRQIETKVAFDMKCNDAFAKGSSEYSDFEDTLGNLRMVGIDEDALGVIVDSDIPHKILHHLGRNPEEAAQLLSLSPVQLAKAVGRLEVKLSAVKSTPKPSAAPEPIKPVNARSTQTNELSDKDDMATWLQKRNAQLQSQRRR